jgi:SsrA-binding protein
MANLVENTKAHFNYEILEKYEAGIELSGHEVKSLKNKQGNLEGAHVLVRGGEAYMVGVLIPPYQEKNTPKDYEPRRNRRLLLNRKEIAELSSKETGKGLTVVPISIYNKGRLIKVSVAVVRGKKKYDKRETTKKREGDREVSRLMKGAR